MIFNKGDNVRIRSSLKAGTAGIAPGLFKSYRRYPHVVVEINKNSVKLKDIPYFWTNSWLEHCPQLDLISQIKKKIRGSLK